MLSNSLTRQWVGKLCFVLFLAFVSVAAVHAEAATFEYEYDQLNRLTKAIYYDGSHTSTLTYQYDSAGNMLQFTSLSSNQNPVFNVTPEVTPEIVGELIVFETLTLADVSAVDPDGDLVSLSYQWRADGADIPEATEDSFRIGQDLIDQLISCEIWADDGYGGTASVIISAVGLVQGGSDIDGDGYTPGEGDCDETNADIYPDALEVCDDSDNNCDEQINEGLVCIADNPDNPALLESTFGTYTTMQSAYDSISVGQGDTLKVKAGDQGLDLFFDKNVTVIFKGGYDDLFENVISHTTMTGTLTISDGQVTISDLTIK